MKLASRGGKALCTRKGAHLQVLDCTEPRHVDTQILLVDLGDGSVNGTAAAEEAHITSCLVT